MSVPFIGFALHGSESSKHFLPSPNEVDSLFQGTDFSSAISQTRFKEFNATTFRLTLATAHKAFKDTLIDKAKVEDIVLSIDPDKAVAYGAAVQAAILTQQTSEKTAPVSPKIVFIIEDISCIHQIFKINGHDSTLLTADVDSKMTLRSPSQLSRECPIDCPNIFECGIWSMDVATRYTNAQ
ncbi:hypothetical protein PSHT_12793, partial [Puccinia striiformis]